jgi:hypothetical protein
MNDQMSHLVDADWALGELRYRIEPQHAPDPKDHNSCPQWLKERPSMAHLIAEAQLRVAKAMDLAE